MGFTSRFLSYLLLQCLHWENEWCECIPIVRSCCSLLLLHSLTLTIHVVIVIVNHMTALPCGANKSRDTNCSTMMTSLRSSLDLAKSPCSKNTRPCQGDDHSFLSTFYMQQPGVQRDQDFQASQGWVWPEGECLHHYEHVKVDDGWNLERLGLKFAW